MATQHCNLPVFHERMNRITYMDSAVVYQNVVHFEVCLLASLLIFELDECVLQRVASLFVPDHLTSTIRMGIDFRILCE